MWDKQQKPVTSVFATTLVTALDPFTQRLSGWQKKKLSDKCWDTIKVMTSSIKQPRTIKWRRRQYNDCLDEEHRWRDRDKLSTCQKEQKERNNSKVWRAVWKIKRKVNQYNKFKQNMMKVFWSTGLAQQIPKATAFTIVVQVVLSCPVTSASQFWEIVFTHTLKTIYKKERTSHQTGFFYSCIHVISK